MFQKPIAVLDAPSNLGLRPPESGSVPGCYKLPWALRNRNLLGLLSARDAGTLVPPRYRAAWQPGEGDRNAEAIAGYSQALADRVQALVDAQQFALVLGGDCSVLLGTTLALKRRGRYGLVFLDAHSDFRHPGNAAAVGAAAGEDLAIVTGRGDPRLTDLEQRGASIDPRDVALVGVRPNDEDLAELHALGFTLITSAACLESPLEATVERALATATAATEGFWVHLDCDVVDASEMSAVDCPEPHGLSFTLLATLLKRLVASPQCVGMELTIYDPDLDPSGEQADRIVACLCEACGASGH